MTVAKKFQTGEEKLLAIPCWPKFSRFVIETLASTPRRGSCTKKKIKIAHQTAFCTNGSIGRSGTQIAEHRVAIEHRKTVVLTSEVQPPSFLHTHNGSKLRVLQQQEAHKWLGCMISAAGSRNTHLDLQHHLPAASKAFHANKWILCDKGVSVLHRLRYFEKVKSPVACLGASHRAIHKDDLAKLDVEYRRLMRMIVGPPPDTNWASPWHEILRGWNKVQVLSD